MSIRSLSVLGLCALAGLSVHCASRRGIGFAWTPDDDDDASAPDGGGGPGPGPGGFKFDDAGSVDAGSKDDGCRLATLGHPAPGHPSDVFSSWLDASGGTKGALALKDQVLTKALLAPYKMIVAQDVSGGHAYTPAEVTELEDWVKAGGGLVTLTGYHGGDEIVNVNRLLAPYGIHYGSTLVLFGGGQTVPVTNWFVHPVTNDVGRIGVDNGFEVLGSAQILAVEANVTVLRAADAGAGHVLAWADEWITFNSEWSSHPDYQVKAFWQNIVDWFAPGSGCKVPDAPPPK